MSLALSNHSHVRPAGPPRGCGGYVPSQRASEWVREGPETRSHMLPVGRVEANSTLRSPVGGSMLGKNQGKLGAHTL